MRRVQVQASESCSERGAPIVVGMVESVNSTVLFARARKCLRELRLNGVSQ